MPFEQAILVESYEAAADLSAKQYHAVKLVAGQAAACTVAGEASDGVLLNDPTSGQEASVGLFGIFPVKLGDTVVEGNELTIDSVGKYVPRTAAAQARAGRALEGGASGDQISALVYSQAIQDDYAVGSYISQADYRAAGQYCAVKAHTVAGKVILASTAGEAAIGILQNAPNAAAAALVRHIGPSSFKASGAGVTPGVELTPAVTTGQLKAASAGDFVCAVSLATVANDAVGACIALPPYRKQPAAQDVFKYISMSIPLASIGDGTIFAVPLDSAGTVVNVKYAVNKAATTADKATTLTPKIGTTAIDSTALTLSSATEGNALTLQTVEQAATANNTFTAASVLNLVASSTTAFVEGHLTVVVTVKESVTK